MLGMPPREYFSDFATWTPRARAMEPGRDLNLHPGSAVFPACPAAESAKDSGAEQQKMPILVDKFVSYMVI